MVWLFLAFFQISLASGAYDISKINSSTGLPSDNVNAIFQDSEGFIWFGTTEGLIRYDGYELKEYSIGGYHDKGLITNWFNAIDEDSDGNLWCATDRGVARFNTTSETFTFYNSQSEPPFQLQLDVINTLIVDEGDHIWLGTAGEGLEVLSPTKGITASYNSSDGVSGMNSDWITHLYLDSFERIWVGSWKGALTLINPKTHQVTSWSEHYFNLEIPHFSPFSLVENEKGDFWLGLWEGGLVHMTLVGDSLVVGRHLMPQTSGLISDVIYDLIIDHNQNLWVGTPFGLNLVTDPYSRQPGYRLFKNAPGDNQISHDEAYALLSDASGLIWVGTSGGGVNKLDDKVKLFAPFSLPEVSPNFKSQSVTAFSLAPDKSLLIGVRSLGFGRYDVEDQTFVQYVDLPEYDGLPIDINTVNCFYWDANGHLWLGTRYMGLVKYDPQTGQSVIINKDVADYDISAREISAIHPDHLGHLWVGSENGLYKIVQYDPDNFLGFNILHYEHVVGNPQSLSSNRISAILQDHNDTLWVATYDHGINKLVSDIRSHFPLVFERISSSDKARNGLITDNINTLFEDQDQNLWIGSGGGGLFRREGPNHHFVAYDAFVSGNIIYNIQQDAAGYLWVSTNRGLTRLAVQDTTVIANNFLQENGLQSNIFNKEAGFKDEKGFLYFGGNSGLNYFNPTEIHPDAYVPPIVITDLRVMTQAVRPVTMLESPLVLNHLKNNFSVTFSALSYSQPENNKYAVILEGLESDWRILNADTRTLDYSNLKPGNYVLKVKAANSNGYWSSEAEKVFIQVNPAPYKTWWAFVLYGLFLGGIILLFLRMEKNNQEVKYALEIEHLEREKSDKLNLFKQGLFANVSHEFLTPLSILSCLMDDWKHLRTAPNGKDLSLAQRNINRLTRLNRQFLYYSKSEVKELPLNVTKGQLNELVKRIGGNFIPLATRNHIHFDIKVDFPDSEVWFDPEKLDVVLFNLLSNAFKYTPENGMVTLQLSINRNNGRSEAVFEVIDSGSGIEAHEQSAIFDRYHSIKGNDQLGGGFGIGLSLCKAMVEAHKGQISLQSEVGTGTRVTFVLPVNRNSFDDSEVYNSLRDEKASTNFLPEKIEEDTILRIKNLNQSFENKPTILLVDDHADFRSLLRTNLDSLFTVLETNNGVTAYEMALNKKVDLIISDIVMPAMNGVEFCTKIKANPSTAHLPVILLTAKSSDMDKAEGYRAGADSFMSKPFNLNTLLTRVEALLEHQKRMDARMKAQKRFSAEVSTSDKDDLVLTRVRGFIEENLANPDLSVKLISSDLAISNSMLYRKTSEILNINPNMLIRKIRMIKAVELLEENQLTVSEIAFKCGYRDVSYFGVSFKKEYGVSPSHFQRNKKT